MLDSSRGKDRDYVQHVYEVQIAVVTLNTDTVGTANLDTDAPFLWLASMGDTQEPNSTTGTDATVMVRIGGAGGRAWSRTPVAWHNCLSTRPVPVMLPAPNLVPPGSQFHVTLNRKTGTVPRTLAVQFIGLKLFGYGG